MKCKICNHETKSILNLGETPLANRLLDNQDEEGAKNFVLICTAAYSVEIFSLVSLFPQMFCIKTIYM